MSERKNTYNNKIYKNDESDLSKIYQQKKEKQEMKLCFFAFFFKSNFICKFLNTFFKF